MNNIYILCQVIFIYVQHIHYKVLRYKNNIKYTKITKFYEDLDSKKL